MKIKQKRKVRQKIFICMHMNDDHFFTLEYDRVFAKM